jgi:L-alanine-DL-glutamate epimerase-like enolase superfamily enzyme
MEEKSTISFTCAGSLAPPMGTYDVIAALPLEIEGYDLETFERPVSSGFVRHTTVVRLHGGGAEGFGEDVTYEAAEHEVLRAGALHDLAGSTTFNELSERVGALDLFPSGEPEVSVRRSYRRWAFESAALDLALRQAGVSLARALGRVPAPVRFVVSRRLPKPPSVEPLRTILAVHPQTRFKLDPTSDWTEETVADLASLDAVEVLDLKGAYRGTVVDNPPDPRLYRLVAEAFPDAVLEDPDLVDPGTAEALLAHHDRVSWDAVIHSVAEIEALAFAPKWLNIKPSRFGSCAELFATYDYCRSTGITMYGGGQFELAVGRGQIQTLASLFHPDGPNDVAPLGYDGPEVEPGTPASPLPARGDETGFR